MELLLILVVQPPASAVRDAERKSGFVMVDIEAALVNRKVWLAASTHSEEENGNFVNPSL